MQGPNATTVQAAAATLLSARAAYTALLAPPSADEIARLEADLHNAQAMLQQAEQTFQTSPPALDFFIACELSNTLYLCYNYSMATQKDLQPIAAVVAAAGLSRRMGAPKQLLPWGDKTVIATVVETLHAAGADPIICVTGHRQAEVSAALLGAPAHLVHNAHYATGEMLSSYQAGIRALMDSECTGVLIALGDQPHLPVAIVGQVVEAAKQMPDRIVIPSYAMRRGHPFYIPRRLWGELLLLRADESLRTLVTHHDDAIHYVEVASDAILRDMDTPADFESLRRDA